MTRMLSVSSPVPGVLRLPRRSCWLQGTVRNHLYTVVQNPAAQSRMKPARPAEQRQQKGEPRSIKGVFSSNDQKIARTLMPRSGVPGTHDICHAHNTRNFTSQEPEASTILSLSHLLGARVLRGPEGKVCPFVVGSLC